MLLGNVVDEWTPALFTPSDDLLRRRANGGFYLSIVRHTSIENGRPKDSMKRILLLDIITALSYAWPI